MERTFTLAKYILTIVFLLTALAEVSLADDTGTVVEVTPDGFKIQQGGIKTQAFVASNELLTNTISGSFPFSRGPNKFTDLKKGAKVYVEYYNRNGDQICTAIRLLNPDDAGIVTEIGKDTITIRNDKGMTTTYKVKKDLVDNSRNPDQYSTVYPCRFSEVRPGRRIEVFCRMEGAELVIYGLDVKKQEEKNK